MRRGGTVAAAALLATLAVLQFPATALAQSTTSSLTARDTVTFTSANQSMWQPGPAASTTKEFRLFEYSWDRGLSKEQPIVGGNKIYMNGRSSGKLGMWLKFGGMASSVGVKYPTVLSTQLPGGGTYAPGSTVRVSATNQLGKGYAITSSWGNGTVSARATAGTHGHLDVGGCFDPVLLDPICGQKRMLALDIPSQGTVTNDFAPVSLSSLQSAAATGVPFSVPRYGVNMRFFTPSVDLGPTSNGGPSMLLATGQKRLVQLDVDLPQTIYWVACVVAAGGGCPPEFPGNPRIDIELKDFFGTVLAKLTGGATTLKAVATGTLDLRQEFTFNARPLQLLTFPVPVEWRQIEARRCGSSQGSGTGTSAVLEVGCDFEFTIPADFAGDFVIQRQAVMSGKSTLRNKTTLPSAMSLAFEALAAYAELTVAGARLGDFSYGPLFSDNRGVKAPAPTVFDRTWTMRGFAPIPLRPLLVSVT